MKDMLDELIEIYAKNMARNSLWEWTHAITNDGLRDREMTSAPGQEDAGQSYAETCS